MIVTNFKHFPGGTQVNHEKIVRIAGLCSYIRFGRKRGAVNEEELLIYKAHLSLFGY
jgi:hypothetical protein